MSASPLVCTSATKVADLEFKGLPESAIPRYVTFNNDTTTRLELSTSPNVLVDSNDLITILRVWNPSVCIQHYIVSFHTPVRGASFELVLEKAAKTKITAANAQTNVLPSAPPKLERQKLTLSLVTRTFAQFDLQYPDGQYPSEKFEIGSETGSNSNKKQQSFSFWNDTKHMHSIVMKLAMDSNELAPCIDNFKLWD